MEDSAAMTVEFLRARLLSERSVSKEAKQRAEELAKKVVELEEQLKVVTLQRKKAEKATVEVLTILENNGIGDFTDSFDSSSDQERIPYESKNDDNAMKEENNRSRKSGVGEGSGSEHEDPSLSDRSLSGRSLSWKSGCTSPIFHEKKKYTETRRQCMFLSTSDSSTKPWVGKSCRKIKPKETRSTEDGVEDECELHDAQENGEASESGNNSDSMDHKPEILIENNERVNLIEKGSTEDLLNEDNADPDVNGNQREGSMESAAENKAELKEQYEEEENAQREWEEKFNKNNSSTLESFEHGNQSDTIEGREGSRDTAEPPDSVSSGGHQDKSEGTEVGLVEVVMTKMVPSGSPSRTCLETGGLQETQCSNNKNIEAHCDSEFSFPCQEVAVVTTKRKEKPGFSDIPCGQSAKRLSLQEYLNQKNEESPSEDQNKLQLTIWHEKPNELEHVLEALQRAKLALKRELNRSLSPTPASPALGKKETRPAIDPVDSTMIPNSWGALFRVPTDLQCKATTETNFLPHPLEGRASQPRNYPNVGNPRNDQYCTRPEPDKGSRTSSAKPYFDPWMDAGLALPPFSKFKYPSYGELVPRVPFNDGMPKHFASIRPEMTTGNHPSTYDNYGRSDMHYRY